MNARLILFSALIMTAAAGCYESSNTTDDAADAAPDTTPDTAEVDTIYPDIEPDHEDLIDTAPPPDMIDVDWVDLVPDMPPDIFPDYPPDYPPDGRPDTPPDFMPDRPECFSNDDCDEREFCEFPAGTCTGPGNCRRRPEGGCPEYYSPECGCDHETYDNQCFRRAEGVSLLYSGECDEESCYPTDPYDVCDEDEFCDGPEGVCGLEGPTGWCEPIPMGCDDFWDPVCGCDGVTYGNDCDRQVAGVWPDHWGECTEACYSSDPYGVCGEDEFCEAHEGLCDMMGASGWCQEPDTSCGFLYDPVCGCDGETYTNDCERQAAGVWLDFWASCDPDGEG